MSSTKKAPKVHKQILYDLSPMPMGEGLSSEPKILTRTGGQSPGLNTGGLDKAWWELSAASSVKSSAITDRKHNNK